VDPDAIRLIAAELEMLLVSPVKPDGLLEGEVGSEEVITEFQTQAQAQYERRENDWGSDLTREVERRVIMSMIDEKWRDHLYEMDMLKEGIGLRAWGQKDPLIEYKREAFGAFEAMMGGLGEDVIRRFFRVSIVQPQAASAPPAAVAATRAAQASHSAFSAFDQPRTPTATSAPTEPKTPIQVEKKVGRNDPCPCGSGKKFKKCHGR
jgi:preprotein translocase subunit SecA